MIAYFDASALVKRYVEEAESDEVDALLAEVVPTTSRLTQIEISSALARRCRSGDLSAGERDRVLDAIQEDLESFYIVELDPSVALRARSVLVTHALRASDAIQIASCLVIRDRLASAVSFVAYDDRLVAAASREGLIT